MALNKEQRAILADILMQYCHDGVNYADESVLDAWEQELTTKGAQRKVVIKPWYSKDGEKVIRYF